MAATRCSSARSASGAGPRPTRRRSSCARPSCRPTSALALKARIAEDRKSAERLRRDLAGKSALRAQRAWESLARDGHAAYLHRKGVQPHGVRFSPKGAVVVPLLDTSGRVHGLQFIHAEKRNGRDKDFWPPGMAKQGHFFHLGPQPTAVLLVGNFHFTRPGRVLAASAPGPFLAGGALSGALDQSARYGATERNADHPL